MRTSILWLSLEIKTISLICKERQGDMLHLKLRSESGMALLVAMFITFLSSIVITFYMGSVIQESKHSVWQKERAQSLFLAEAGIQKGLYYLNNLDDPGNPWSSYIDHSTKTLLVSSGQGFEYTGTDVDDPTDRYEESYTISLHDSFVDENDTIIMLPPKYYLIKSTGTIKRTIPIYHSVSAIVSTVPGLPTPGALNIFDVGDDADELLQFQSSKWVISGVDIDGGPGVPGITISNTKDDLLAQLDGQGLPTRMDQVEGENSSGFYVNSVSAINAYNGGDNSSSILEMLYDYFYPLSDHISGIGQLRDEYLGGPEPDELQILYADLDQGALIIPGNRTGYGVLILEGDGVFEMKGNSEWRGLVICHGGAKIVMRGGGKTAPHVYGAVMIDTGTVTMNGTADIRYSSIAMSSIVKGLMKFQVFSWCGSWGKPLGRFGRESYTAASTL